MHWAGSDTCHDNGLGKEGNCLNSVNGIYEKPTANTILHGEKTENFSPPNEE